MATPIQTSNTKIIPNNYRQNYIVTPHATKMLGYLTQKRDISIVNSSVSSSRLWLWKVEKCNGSNGTTRFENFTGI
jgi:hypothetical protein